MATRYQDYVTKMLDENNELFDKFKKIHDDYSLKGDQLQEDYNKIGEVVLRKIQDYEDKLCSNQERGMYNKFSGGLSEKFRDEIRKVFPMIDHIGLKVEKVIQEKKDNNDSGFFLKKISLF